LFARTFDVVSAFEWEHGIRAIIYPGPTQLAPFAFTLEAEVDERYSPDLSARLVVLHDPSSPTAWAGTFRCVAYVSAPVDSETANDPLLPEVGWSWLTDALDGCQAEYGEPSGTVTTITGRGFGGKADEHTCEIELRASWTPLIRGELDIEAHLRAWEELLLLAAGAPHALSGPTTGASRR
jgi:hypothetical protein